MCPAKMRLMPYLLIPDSPCGDNLFEIQLTTDALIGAHIMRGDRAVFCRSTEFGNDDLIIIERGALAMVRYAYKEPGELVRLESRNPKYGTLHLPLIGLPIIGVVVRIARDL